MSDRLGANPRGSRAVYDGRVIATARARQGRYFEAPRSYTRAWRLVTNKSPDKSSWVERGEGRDSEAEDVNPPLKPLGRAVRGRRSDCRSRSGASRLSDFLLIL